MSMIRRIMPLLLFGYLLSCTEGRSPEQYQNYAKSITGGDFCSSSDTTIEEVMTHTTLNVSASPPRCAIWPESIPGVVMASGKIFLAGIDVPLIVYLKKAKTSAEFSPPERIFIRVAGGPGLPIGPYGFESLYMNGIGPHDIMIAIGYAGTFHGSRYPNENVTLATAQIAELVKLLRSRMKMSKIYMIGESLGGPISVAALEKIDLNYDMGLILIVPMIDSPIQQLKYIRKNVKELYPSRPYTSVKIIRYRNGKLKNSDTKQVDGVDLFETFFPKAEMNVTLDERLTRARIADRSLLVIFGSEDHILEPSGVHKFIKRHPGSSVLINGVSHGMTEKNARHVTKEIARFVKRHG